MSEATYLALQVSGIGLAGVFVFMILFYFIVIGIDKTFPHEKTKKD